MNPIPTPARSTEKQRGQAMAETAIVLVFLLLLLSVVVDAGRIMFTWLAMQNAAAEGAYYATTFRHVGTTNGTDPDTIAYRAQNESPSVLLDWNKPGTTIAVTYLPTRSTQLAGDFVTVTVTYPFEMVGPLPGLLGFPENIPISASATQVVLADFTQPEPTP